VSRGLGLTRVNALKREIADAVRAQIGAAEVTVVAHPQALDNETVHNRVALIAAHQQLPIHDLVVHQAAGQLAIGFDHHDFEYAAGAIEITIVLASAAAITEVMALAVLSGGVGAAGVVLCLLGLLSPMAMGCVVRSRSSSPSHDQHAVRAVSASQRP
jgi:hypothetical protein